MQVIENFMDLLTLLVSVGLGFTGVLMLCVGVLWPFFHKSEIEMGLGDDFVLTDFLLRWLLYFVSSVFGCAVALTAAQWVYAL